MNIIGIILNFLAIIALGDYGVADDGPLVHEDSPVYSQAYTIRGALAGDVYVPGPNYTANWFASVERVADRVEVSVGQGVEATEPVAVEGNAAGSAVEGNVAINSAEWPVFETGEPIDADLVPVVDAYYNGVRAVLDGYGDELVEGVEVEGAETEWVFEDDTEIDADLVPVVDAYYNGVRDSMWGAISDDCEM